MVIDNKTKEKLVYLLDHLDSFVEEETYRCLSDSEEDPQRSAVTLFNLITSYLDVMRVLGQEQIPANVTDYLLDKCFTNDEITILHEKKNNEAEYYVGKVFK